jgi:KipI family sensor histidine kinase inhibitor
VRSLPYGEAGLLVEPDDAASVLRLASALRGEPGVVEVVPAARTLLVRAAPAVLERLTARLPELVTGGSAPADLDAAEVVLDVDYDGPDLADTAAELGLEPDELVRRHLAGEYVVAFCGFAPGFAYLRGLDETLHVGRRAQPRTRVPAGSVGIAGEFTGVYPRESPGGWRLLGRTNASLWDLERKPPALLAPGTRVRFRPGGGPP